MCVQYYSYKFTKLSKYAPSWVSNPRDEMNHFITGVSDDLVEEFRSGTLHLNMDISDWMIHAQQVEENRLKKKSRKFKRVKAYEGGTSKGRLEIQDKPRFKKRVSYQVPSNFPNANKDRVS
ncbi:hypothetical protein EJD97_007358 [Solanum chilense]|uniref:Uncharacterized protein n=1 Tax=Solanum chilense TaxID=4083 RepID=A0A6N2BMT7_SOLCI|nr:hypothetical protein EJD97_007358 [Solanum chilense]